MSTDSDADDAADALSPDEATFPMDARSPDSDPPPVVPPRLSSPSEAISVSVGVTLATAIVMTFAFDPRRAGTPAMLIAIGLNYALMGAFALHRLAQRGELRSSLRPARLDITFGAVVAGVLYGAAHLVDQTIAAHGSIREAWLMRIYLQLGDPDAPSRVLVGGVVFVIAAMEELVWRGLVMRTLAAVYGYRPALIVTSILFALAHAPTLFLLADPIAGLNPLLVLAALGCGLVWGLVYLRTGRLVPALFAHALFSWAVIEFPIWRP